MNLDTVDAELFGRGRVSAGRTAKKVESFSPEALPLLPFAAPRWTSPRQRHDTTNPPGRGPAPPLATHLVSRSEFTGRQEDAI
jgi:hypothetical protein